MDNITRIKMSHTEAAEKDGSILTVAPTVSGQRRQLTMP